MKQIKIIRKSSLQDFENKINELVNAGWKIKGDIIIDNENYLYAKMTKRIIETEKSNS